MLVVLGHTHKHCLDLKTFIMSTARGQAAVMDTVAKGAASGVRLSKVTPQLVIR